MNDRTIKCKNCKFSFLDMKNKDAEMIKGKNPQLKNIQHAMGQKFCFKRNIFTFPESHCSLFIEWDKTN